MMLNSKVFRLFWRDNLRSTRRRSASCPNLEHLSQDSETQANNSQDCSAFISASESESDDGASKMFVERLKVQRSIRKVHKREKEKKENAEKNLISMDDYLGKLSELKMWLKEEQKKDVSNMSSPKLKAHFKTFVKLWNKRKLPLKYYKSCSVDLHTEDQPLSPYSQQPINYLHSPFEESVKFSASILHTPFSPLCEESLDHIGTPLSTFGKCDGLLSSPTVVTEQVENSIKSIKKREVNFKESNPRSHNKFNVDKSLPNTSPPKFATISRSVPASSLYKFTAQPWSSATCVRARPVLSPKCPDSQGHLFSSSSSNSPALKSYIAHNRTTGEQKDKTDVVNGVSSFTNSSGPSPVYSTTVDAIPYNTGSPKYAEIDESICNTPQKLAPPVYCSISPLQKWKPVHTDVKPSVSKKQSLNRRRSKSMEDIYSLPFKAGNLVRFIDFTHEEYSETLETPPIPDRKYSPLASYSTCSESSNNKSPVYKDSEDYSICHTSSKVTLPFVSSPPESSPHKRSSQEGVESVDFATSSLKKAKSSVSSSVDIPPDLSKSSLLSTPESEGTATPVFSILTGSLNPTTRSKYKLDNSMKSSQNDIAVQSESSQARLSIIKIQQLDESPKLYRRRLKRRSSSLSTTPGKGLTFGKASKMSAASPRRVSFAKNMKETEKKTVPGKSFPASYTVARSVTRQTHDRKEFEYFLSSHENLPKIKSSNPDNKSPPKGSSPVKRSSPQKYNSVNVASVSKENYGKENSIRTRDLFTLKYDSDQNIDSRLNTDSPADVDKEVTSQLSPKRQAGRRVVGVPKASSDKSILASGNTGDQTSCSKYSTGGLTDTVGSSALFPTRQVGRRVLGAPRASPDKNTAGGSAWVHSPKKVQNVDNFPPNKSIQAVSQVVVSHRYLEASPQKKLPSSPQGCLKSSPRSALSQSSHFISSDNIENSPSLHIAKVSTKSISSQKHSRPQEHTRSPPKQLNSPPKDKASLTRYHSTAKKLFDLSSSVSASKISVASFVSKLTEKTSTICAKELSESDDCLSSEEIFSASISQPDTSGILAATLDNIETPSNMNPPSSGLQTEQEDFKMMALEDSPGSKTRDVNSSISHSVAACDVSAQKPVSTCDLASKAAAYETENLPQMYSTTDKRSLQDFDGISSMPLVQEYSGFTYNQQKTSDFSRTCHLSKLNDSHDHKHVKAAVDLEHFKLPVVDVTPHHKITYSSNENLIHSKETSCQNETAGHSHVTLSSNKTEMEKCCSSVRALKTELHQTSPRITFPEVDDTQESSLTSSSDYSHDNENVTLSASPAENEGQCNLKRLASIKASPKVVDNDSWITERRRSSRGKSKSSFRSAYNKYLLKSSFKEYEEAETNHPPEIENLSMTVGFVDSKTGAITSFEGGHTPDILSENSSSDMLKKDVSSHRHSPSHDKDQVTVTSADNMSISSPAKVKPQTLPKPSKASLLARKNFNAANKNERNTGKSISNRRSSTVKPESVIPTPPQPQKSRQSQESHKTRLSSRLEKPRDSLSSGKGKSCKRVSFGKYKASTRKSSETDKCLESIKQKFNEDGKRLESTKQKSSEGDLFSEYFNGQITCHIHFT